MYLARTFMSPSPGPSIHTGPTGEQLPEKAFDNDHDDGVETG